MPKSKKHQKRSSDINQLAHQLVDASTGMDDSIPAPTASQISRFMAELGRKGGKIGGKRRLETMSAKERTAVARKAAQVRWKPKES